MAAVESVKWQEHSGRTPGRTTLNEQKTNKQAKTFHSSDTRSQKHRVNFNICLGKSVSGI